MPTDVAQSDIIAEALKLAKAQRSAPSSVFERRYLGRLTWPDMQFRETYLLSVLEYLDGNTNMFFDPMPAEEKDKDQENKPGRMQVPKARRWLQVWASTYKKEPRRTYFRNGERLRSSDPIVTKIQKRTRDAEIDATLAYVDYSMRAMGNVVVRPWFDQDNDELVYHVYLSPNVRVLENHNNPRRPYATIIIGSRIQRDDSAHAMASRVQVAEVWTNESVIHWDADKGITLNEPLVTEKPPLVHCFESIPTPRSGYYVSAPGATLVALNAILDNDYFTQFGYILLMQGLGIASIHGFEGNPTIGPGHVIKFPGNPDRREEVNYSSTNAPLTEWMDAIKFISDEIRESYGIPQSMLDVKTDSSGAAIVQANGPTMEIRESREKTFRRIETELLRATIGQLTNHDPDFPNGLNPEEFDVQVDYGSQSASVSVTDQIALDKHFIELGVMTPADVLMREQPDKFDTVEQAEEFLTPDEDDAATPTIEDLQASALNGAQITALQGVIESVATGVLPKAAGIEVIAAGFPQIPRDRVEAMIAPIQEGSVQPTQNEPPATSPQDADIDEEQEEL